MIGAAFHIIRVRDPADLCVVTDMFRAYADGLGIDLSYQGFDAELAEMPGRYAPPSGEILLARDGTGAALGCVALRRLASEVCEMKRLYVCPDGRGKGVGQALVQAVFDVAQGIGYRELRLDTLPSMHAAFALYRKAGFEVYAPYYEKPLAGTIFLGRRL